MIPTTHSQDHGDSPASRKNGRDHGVKKTLTRGARPFVEPRPTRSDQPQPQPTRLPSCYNISPESFPDPIEFGMLSETQCTRLLGEFFAGPNLFINLLDPQLHTLRFLREQSKFLFTVLMMVTCTFSDAEYSKPLRQMANTYARKAWFEQDMSVEAIQAFCCLTYWQEPGDSKSWSYVGHACRAAVDVRLGEKTPSRASSETGARQKRNCERTRLVLFAQDRDLSSQTGRQWMLPEDDLVETAAEWATGDPEACPGDVMVAASAMLQCLITETCNVFGLRKGTRGDHSDVDYDVLLRGCNTKLDDWSTFWHRQIIEVGNPTNHLALFQVYRAHARLFLNSISLIQCSQLGVDTNHLHSIHACYTNAKAALEAVTKLAELRILRYATETVAVKSAYASIFILRLVRETKENALEAIPEPEARQMIQQAAGSFRGQTFGDGPFSIAAHARFLSKLASSSDDEANIDRTPQEIAPDGKMSCTGDGHCLLPATEGGLVRSQNSESSRGKPHQNPHDRDDVRSRPTLEILRPLPVDEGVDNTYAASLYEQVGIRKAQLQEVAPYASPAGHPYLPLPGNNWLSQFGGR